jgi:hypothetical protein
MNDKKYLKILMERWPPPETMDLLEARDIVKAEKVWGDLEKKGYVKISDYAICGFEKVKGRFVSITVVGLQRAKDKDDEN